MRPASARLALSPRTGRYLFVAAVALTTPALAFVVDDLGRILLLLSAALAALFVIRRPHWGVLAMGPVWMLGIDPVGVGPLKTVELLALLLLVPLAADVAHERRVWILGVPQLWLILGIGLVLVASTVWSELMHPPPPHASYELAALELRHLMKNLIILVFFVSFIRAPRHILYAVAIFLLVILVFTYDALDPLGGGPSGQRADARGMADPNRLGALCVWGTALFWSFRFHSSARRWRALALIPLFGLPFVALLTASRSAFLQLLLLAALILLEQRHWSPARRVRGFALLLAIGFVVLVAAPNASLLRVTSYRSEVGDPGWYSTQSRTQGIWAGLMMAAEHPFLGVGPGNFRWRIGRQVGPHNSYLWALTSGGPALLALYLLLLRRTYRAFQAAEQSGPRRLEWVARGLRLCLIVFAFFSLFADVWLQHPLYWLVGMSIVLARQVPAPAVAPACPVSLASAARSAA
jgi:O-antigen ligase